MAHEVLPGVHPHIVVFRAYGAMELDDMLLKPAQVQLDRGHRIYLLVDTAQLTLALPPRFLEAVRKSVLGHPNLAHMAIYTTNAGMRALVNMAIQITVHRNKVTIHESYSAAEQTLLNKIAEPTSGG